MSTLNQTNFLFLLSTLANTWDLCSNRGISDSLYLGNGWFVLGGRFLKEYHHLIGCYYVISAGLIAGASGVAPLYSVVRAAAAAADSLTQERLQYWTRFDPFSFSAVAPANPAVADGRFFCPKCPRSYRNKNHLYRHIRYECDRKKQYRCGICLKDFYRRDNLKTHINYKHAAFLRSLKAEPKA